jgi:hypothetical protein
MQNNITMKHLTKNNMKKETLEEAAKKHATGKSSSPVFQAVHTLDFIAGALWQQKQDKKMYSEEEVMFAYHQGARLALISQSPLALHKGKFPTPKEWFYENFKNK